MSRVDLHLHSRYSDRPSEWILRRLGMPQSYSDPETLYQRLDAAGMTFKTITDHNRIEGCLEISHHPDVFLSEEVTTYFPDGCKIHLLVWNISEAQHADIQNLRSNIFELAAYLRTHRLSHAIAHALVSLNGLLTTEHFEKLILLFKTFEGRNGNREPLAQEIAALCLLSLTPEKIEELANRHDLPPTHLEAHRKIFTGGSDDHSGLYPGRTWTQGPETAAPADFFAGLERGDVSGQGPLGEPLRLSASLYTTVFNYAQDKLRKSAPLGANLMKKMAERFLAGQNPTAFSFGEKMGHVFEGLRTGQAFDFLKPGETSLTREVASFVSDAKLQKAIDQIIVHEPNLERRSFRIASHLSNQLAYRLGTQFLSRLQRGNFLDGLQSLTGLLPVGGVIFPYFVAFRHHDPDRPLLEKVSRSLTGSPSALLSNHKRAWFTDTLEDINGVARTIRSMTLAARQAGADLTVVTSRSEISLSDIPIQNFTPVGEFEIPEYELQKLSFPPLLEMIDYIQREGFTELIVSTPGPVGLCALAAGKLLGLRLSSIYHTDFPQYARFLSDDALMETLVWNYMQWFYGQFPLIYVNSEFYRHRWIDRGIAPERLKILPRGLDTELFNPKHRDPAFWKKRGARGPVLLYVGRISREKDLSLIAEIAPLLKVSGIPFTLALVGEGPYRAELQELLPEAIFTGILTGQELGVAYASADLFVFPSTTDTFGNVVIEALSAGLRVAVSDVGGPRELVRSPEQGRVLPARQGAAWADALADMLGQLPSLEQRIAMSRLVQGERSWDRAFQVFWQNSA